MEMKDTSTIIIIVTYNAMPWIHACLSSVKTYDVVVVDNASTDETVTYIESHFPAVHLIKATENIGFGQANNIGIQYALNRSADYVFLLNQDAYLQKDALTHLLVAHKNHSSFGILSPVHFNGDGTTLDRKFSNYLVYDYNPNFYGDAINGNLQEIYEVEFVNAAGWLIPVDVIRKVGGFDPVFFMYGEDDNLSHRMKFHGYKIGVVSKAHMHHDRKNVPNKIPTQFSKEYFKERRLFYFSKLGNINKRGVDIILAKEVKKLNKEFWRNILSFKINRGKFFRREKKMLQNIYPEILESRKRNEALNSYFK